MGYMNNSRHNLNEVEQVNLNQSFFSSSRKFEDISIELFFESDLSYEYLVWLNNSNYMQYSDQQLEVHTLDTSRDYLKSFTDSPNLFLKVLNSSGVMVGTLTVYIDVNHKVHHCGILVDPNAAKRGFGRKAWMALTHHICPNLGARKVVAGTLESNIAMIKLFEISEMNFEARLCDEKQYGGKLYDVLIYSRFCPQ
jgi:RimJ/RimL family protein N-acetyltransferase